MDLALVALLLATARLATPLAIAAIGELVAERAGVLNIGIEGMMLAGAFAGFAVGSATGSVALGVAAASLAGTELAALFALFVLGRGADPIVAGTALNVFALGSTGTAYRLLFPPEQALPLAPQLGDLVPGLNGFVIATLLLTAGVAFFMLRTRAGLTLRAVGERADGYVGIVDPSAPGGVVTMVQNINGKRRAKYQGIAAKNGTSLQAVEAIVGKKLIRRAKPGEYIMDSAGRWRRK